MEEKLRKAKKFMWLDAIKVIGTFLIVLQHSISMEWIRTVSTRDELRFCSILYLWFQE